MIVFRALLYQIIFYPATALLSASGSLAGLVSRKPMLVVIRAWVDLNHWLVLHVLRMRVRVEGKIAPGAQLIAAKHQSMFETTEMLRLSDFPVIVMKQELADIPIFGWLTRRYGIIAVQRSAGAKALRALVAEGARTAAQGRSVLIFPEGTRVLPGQTPPLKPGFAALYRALGLPVVPVALDSGVVWGRGLRKRRGTITFRIGETIPPGLPRAEMEARVHAAINALESSPQPRS
ncbi:MAG: lysophospholipid acyltransferase family protein [Sphingomicrobium sp.]